MTMIDPFSPAFEDYPYDPHPGSPGDLYDPQELAPRAVAVLDPECAHPQHNPLVPWCPGCAPW
jgi:hypothetical protein